MATPDLLDFELLLSPISAERPSGEDLWWGIVHEEIKSARKQGNRKFLKDGAEDETHETKDAPPNWSAIVDQATNALVTRSKDLMIGAWLTEALISLHGFAGCRDGLKLINELLERYWDSVYPQVPDDGDLGKRLGPLIFCTTADSGGKFPILLRESPLIPSSGDAVFNWNYWESSFRLKPKGDKESDDAFAARKQRSEEQVKAYQEAMRASSRDSIQNLLEDLQATMSEVSRFNDILEQRFDRLPPGVINDAGLFDKKTGLRLARLSPGVSDLRKALEDCIDIAERALKEKGGADSVTDETGDCVSQTTGASASWGGSLASGSIRSRQDALNRLEEIAKYLRQVEPHSPVSYLVQRAVNWGRMPFEDLLQELLKDTTVRAQVGELLGIKSPER